MAAAFSRRYLSLEAEPPPGFEGLAEPSRRALRRGIVALWTRDCEALMAELGPLAAKIRGVILCPGEARRQTRIGPTLWRLEVSEASTPALVEIADAWLGPFAEALALRDELGHRELELERERHDRSILVDKLDRETRSLRDRLSARTLWTAEAMTALVGFGARVVEAVETAELPALVVAFLVAEPLRFSGASVSVVEGGSWRQVATAGEPAELELPAPAELGDAARLSAEAFAAGFSRASSSGSARTCAVLAWRKGRFDEADASFLTLFADQLAGLYRARALNRALAQASARKDALIAELSTPIIQVWHDMVCLPVIGSVDGERAEQITAELLDAVASRDVREVIVDFTGISNMDTETVRHFTGLARAIALLGARCVLTGITPAIARTLVSLGVELSELETRSSLQAALASRLGR